MPQPTSFDVLLTAAVDLGVAAMHEWTHGNKVLAKRMMDVADAASSLLTLARAEARRDIAQRAALKDQAKDQAND